MRASTSDPPLTVLIPTHGRPTLLERTLASLAACHLPVSYRETVVIENGSRAGAEAVVAEHAAAHPALALRYLHVERGNKSAALNAALNTVAQGIVVFFDDDVRLHPGVLESYAAAATGRTDGVYFGGSFGVDYEEPPPEWLTPLLPPSARGRVLGDGRHYRYYLGFNWAAFTQDLEAIGGFDPNFGPGSPTGTTTGDENDIQARLREAGVQAVDVPDAHVWHYVAKDRCTPAWAVRRTYLAGIAAGQRERRRGQRGLVRSSLVTAGKAGALTAARLLRGHTVESWTSAARAARHVGRLVGYLRAEPVGRAAG